MLNTLRKWLIRVLTAPAQDVVRNHLAVEDMPYRSTSSIVPYDENLLERSLTQWQFGDWASLAALDRDTLQHHPDRAKLALLAAAGHAQQGQAEQARQFTRLAQDWGCSKKLITQVLISGVHNTLGRASASGGYQARALKHFGNSIAIGGPGGETTLLAQARSAHQIHQLGLPPAIRPPNVAMGRILPAAKPIPSANLAKLQQPPEQQLSQLGLHTPEGYFKVRPGATAMPALELSALDKKVESLTATLEQQKAELDTAKNALKAEKKLTLELQSKSIGRDDDIDELIEDLSLFFYGRFIVYVDVGAYVGEVFKKLFDSRKVKIREAHLFEPNPESYVELKKAVEGNHSMHAHNLAIGKKECTVQLISSKTMTKVIDSKVKQGLGDVFDAQCVSLDSQSSLFTDGKINLLKIDVEGRELDVLEGASQLLESQSVDMIYIEVGFNRQGTQQTYFGKIDAALQAFGYRVFKIYEQKNEWICDSPMLRRSNFAYMSQKFADANPSTLVRKMRAIEQELRQIKSL